jgi:hypothetical protein
MDKDEFIAHQGAPQISVFAGEKDPRFISSFGIYGVLLVVDDPFNGFANQTAAASHQNCAIFDLH